MIIKTTSRQTTSERIKQKIWGLIITILSVIIPLVDGDATASVLILPLGIYAIFTKNKVFDF